MKFYRCIDLWIATLVLLASCNSPEMVENKEGSMDTVQTIKDRLADSLPAPTPAQVLPEAFLFKYSECMGSCKDEPGIKSMKDKSDSLFLKFAAVENCIAKFIPKLKYSHDTVWIDVNVKPELWKNRKGGYDTIMVTNDCDCFFYFEVGIKNLIHGHKIIYIDGNKMGKGRQMKTIEEPDIFSLKQDQK